MLKGRRTKTAFFIKYLKSGKKVLPQKLFFLKLS